MSEGVEVCGSLKDVEAGGCNSWSTLLGDQADHSSSKLRLPKRLSTPLANIDHKLVYLEAPGKGEPVAAKEQ